MTEVKDRVLMVLWLWLRKTQDVWMTSYLLDQLGVEDRDLEWVSVATAIRLHLKAFFKKDKSRNNTTKGIGSYFTGVLVRQESDTSVVQQATQRGVSL